MAAALLVFFWECAFLWELIIDDAYITYRFAARLGLEGHLRWNGLEGPVEGYTSFLAVLLSAPMLWVTADPIWLWKGLGLILLPVGALITACGVRAFGRILGFSFSPALCLLAAAGYLLDPAGAVHAMSGMETALFTFLLTAAAALCLRLLAGAVEDQPPGQLRPFMWALALLFLALGWTRPESLLWSGTTGFLLFLGLGRGRRKAFFFALCGGFVLPGTVYFMWRLFYFESLLPSTFYAKAAGAEGGEAFLPSLNAVWHYLRDFQWVWMGLAFLGGLAALLDLREKFWTPARLVLVLLPVPALACIAFFAHIHLLMGYAHRFLYPYGQSLWLLLVPWAFCLFHLPFRKAARNLVGLLFFAAALGLFLNGAGKAAFGPENRWKGYLLPERGRGHYNLMEYNRLMPRGYRHVGRVLREIWASENKPATLFHHNMGELYFFARNWDSIDPVGLVDKKVARQGFSLDYLFSKEPEMLLLPSRKADAITEYRAELFPDISRALFLDPRIGGYIYLGYYPHLKFGPEGRMHAFLREETAQAHPEMVRRLQRDLPLRQPEHPLQ